MTHTFGNNKALPPSKIDNAILEIDQEMSVQNEKEFINILVFVPVIFALHHGHPDDGVIHFAKRLVIPFVGAGIGQLLHINQFERPVQNVQVSFVWKLFNRCFRGHRLEFTKQPCSPKFNFLRSCFPDSFFAVEIIRLLTLDNDAIGG